jgi:hypothetical protein
VVLTTHLLLVLIFEWVGAIPPPPNCACIGMPWFDLKFIEIYVLYGCGTWSFKRGKICKLKGFENRVARVVFELRRKK